MKNKIRILLVSNIQMKVLTVIFWVTVTLVFYAYSFRFISNRAWPLRAQISALGLVLGMPYIISFIWEIIRHEGNPGGGMVIIFPFIYAIGGYVVGLILDLIKKNKTR